MTRQTRAVHIRSAAGVLIVAAGALHSLYYISGMARGWERDWWNFLQVAAGLIFTALGLWILLWRKKQFSGKGLFLLRIAQAFVCLGLISFLVVEGMIWNAGRSTAAGKTDVLLILGARVRGEAVSLSLRDRLEEGLAYLKKYPQTPVLLSGGQGPGESLSEAAAMKKYLTDRGVPSGQILLEDRSTDTFENVTFSKELLEKNGYNPESTAIALVTNDFHMLRAKLLAKRAGLHVTGLSARTPEYTIPKAYTREFAALIKSFLFDR